MIGFVVAFAGMLLVCLVEEIKHRRRTVARRTNQRRAVFASRGAR